MGAWIEITELALNLILSVVASFMGAWIEILRSSQFRRKRASRILYGCVD